MLILLGVTIAVAINGGLIEKSRESTDKWDIAQQNELSQMNEAEKAIIRYTGETISKDVAEMEENNISYIGYFADVDNDEEVDGVIFADLLVGTTSTEYTIDTIKDATTVKNYEVIQESYTVPNASGYASKPVLKATGDGVDRFYVMALEDFTYVETKSDNTTETHTEFCWYWRATYDDRFINAVGDILPQGFGKGYDNTQTMIAKYKDSEYGTHSQYYLEIFDENLIGDLFEAGWFIPSRYEWVSFLDSLETNGSENGVVGNYNFEQDYYWTSSKAINDYDVYNAAPIYGGSVRLASTNNEMSVRFARKF